MKVKPFSAFIIVFLLFVNIFIITRFNKIKKEKVLSDEIGYRQLQISTDELNSYKTSFISNILNSDLKLNNFLIKDSLNQLKPLKKVFDINQKKVLVFRFSKLHCESCIDSSIGILKKRVDSIGMKNVIFIGNYRNNRIFYRTISVYGIQDMRVYNAPDFNIQAENLGYPYFFILDNNLKTSNVFVPNKAFPEITNKYLEALQTKF